MGVEEAERCRNGHKRTEANTMWEKLPNGKKRRRCRICRNLRNGKSHSEDDQIVVGGTHLIDNTLYDHSALSIDDRIALVKFDKAMDKVNTKCKDRPGEFTDWGGEGEFASEIPSVEWAGKLCADCPLFDLCREAAEAAPPAWGIRAGDVWVFGNKYTQGEYSADDNRDSSK